MTQDKMMHCCMAAAERQLLKVFRNSIELHCLSNVAQRAVQQTSQSRFRAPYGMMCVFTNLDLPQCDV